MRKLRDKLEALEPSHTFIQTRYGVGYKFEPTPKDAAERASQARS